MDADNEESFEQKRARQQQAVDKSRETHETFTQQRRTAEQHKPSPDQEEDHQKWVSKCLEDEQQAQAEEIRARRELQKLENEEKERKLHDDYLRSRQEQKQREEEQKVQGTKKKV